MTRLCFALSLLLSLPTISNADDANRIAHWPLAKDARDHAGGHHGTVRDVAFEESAAIFDGHSACVDVPNSKSLAVRTEDSAIAQLASKDSSEPFYATTDLFDTSNTKTLGLKRIKGVQTPVYHAPEDGYKFCHHPNLVIFQDRMYCMWSNGLVGEDEPGQRILYSSTADGRKWTEPEVLTDDKQGKGICVAAGFQVAGDNLVAYYTATGGQNFHPDTALLARTSVDGRRWSKPERIASGFFIEGPRQLPSGRLILAGEHVGDARGTKRAQLLYTDDPGGLTGWKQAPIEMPELKVFGYTEPSFFRRGDSLIATIRNYSGNLYATVSADDGQSWSTPVQTNVPDSTARTSAGNLPDGTAYLINNPGPKQFDRSLLTIALSRDGCKFDRACLVRGEPTKKRHEGQHKLDGWQYPNAIAWKDDFYIAYSINKEDVAITRIALDDLTK